jgi:hypothetical protein
MDKALLTHGDLKLYQMKFEDIFPFINKLSPENFLELEQNYQVLPEDFLVSALNNQMTHIVKVSDEVVAACGIMDGFLWTVFSSDVKKHWRKFVKASPNLINYYHYFHEDIYCEVWEQNVFVLNWLLHLGFDPIDRNTLENGNVTVKFVRCLFDGDDIDCDVSRPVMH